MPAGFSLQVLSDFLSSGSQVVKALVSFHARTAVAIVVFCITVEKHRGSTAIAIELRVFFGRATGRRHSRLTVIVTTRGLHRILQQQVTEVARVLGKESASFFVANDHLVTRHLFCFLVGGLLYRY